MFEASQQQIKDIIFVDNKILKIPKYQRPYTWSKDQLDDFWEDLFINDSPFIGTFILNVGSSTQSGEVEVIDGQQRLLTITIFLSVLRDIAKSLTLSELAERIQKKTIVTEDFKGVIKSRVLVGDSLISLFNELIQNYNEPTNLKIQTKEEKNVTDNYEYFSEKIASYLTGASREEAEEKIQSLLLKISHVNCVVISIDNDLDAYSIFETVNARGVDLSVADLLKNHIFKNLESKNKLDFGISEWEKLSNNILDTEIDLKKFLRYFWLSKYSFVTERELFKDIKKKSVDPEILLSELVSSSDLYLRMVNNNPADWSDYSEARTIKKTLDAIEIMGVTQCHVLFLAVLRNHQKLGSNLRRIFSTIEKFTFLYSAVSKLQANKVEKLYSKCAIDLEKEFLNPDEKNRQKNIQRIVDKLLVELQNLKPGKGEFQEKFAQIQYKNSTKARKLITYILSHYDKHLSGEEMSINFDVVNIEHIIPQNPNSDWDVNKKIIKEYVNLLGNLVLVHREYNSKAGNKSLPEKCEILSKTKIETTKEVIKSIQNSKCRWDEDDIYNRQKNLAEEAYSIWSI